jgi:hypothetical protein
LYNGVETGRFDGVEEEDGLTLIIIRVGGDGPSGKEFLDGWGTRVIPGCICNPSCSLWEAGDGVSRSSFEDNVAVGIYNVNFVAHMNELSTLRNGVNL